MASSPGLRPLWCGCPPWRPPPSGSGPLRPWTLNARQWSIPRPVSDFTPPLNPCRLDRDRERDSNQPCRRHFIPQVAPPPTRPVQGQARMPASVRLGCRRRGEARRLASTRRGHRSDSAAARRLGATPPTFPTVPSLSPGCQRHLPSPSPWPKQRGHMRGGGTRIAGTRVAAAIPTASPMPGSAMWQQPCRP